MNRRFKFLALALLVVVLAGMVLAPAYSAFAFGDPDSDGDGVRDSIEEKSGSDPNDPYSVPSTYNTMFAQSKSTTTDPWADFGNTATKAIADFGGPGVPQDRWYYVPLIALIIMLLCYYLLIKFVFKAGAGGGIGENTEKYISAVIAAALGLIAVTQTGIVATLVAVGITGFWLVIAGGIIVLTLWGIVGMAKAGAGARTLWKGVRKEWMETGAEKTAILREEGIVTAAEATEKKMTSLTIGAEERLLQLRNLLTQLSTLRNTNAQQYLRSVIGLTGSAISFEAELRALDKRIAEMDRKLKQYENLEITVDRLEGRKVSEDAKKAITSRDLNINNKRLVTNYEKIIGNYIERTKAILVKKAQAETRLAEVTARFDTLTAIIEAELVKLRGYLAAGGDVASALSAVNTLIVQVSEQKQLTIYMEEIEKLIQNEDIAILKACNIETAYEAALEKQLPKMGRGRAANKL